MGKFQTHQRLKLSTTIYFDLGGTYPLKIRPTQVHSPRNESRGNVLMQTCNALFYNTIGWLVCINFSGTLGRHNKPPKMLEEQGKVFKAGMNQWQVI